jgi:hypothetical protein
LAVVLPALAQRPDRGDPLARARQLHNEGRYDEAIVAAREARQRPAAADGATLVEARAHLERFRRQGDQAILEEARQALRAIRPAALALRERTEMVIGLGELLYLEDAFGAAAEMFEAVLPAAGAAAGGRMRDRVLDWWASALDRAAQARPVEERPAVYARIIDRMEAELRADAGLGIASYWLAAAARGGGDVDRAWDAAIAGWLRAPLNADGGAALRGDLDRLVTEVIIPERVRRLAPQPRDPTIAAGAFREEWEAIKRRWQ